MKRYHKFMLACAALMLITSPAMAKSPIPESFIPKDAPMEIVDLIKAEATAMNACHFYVEACDSKNTFDKLLATSGWCFGKENQTRQQGRWHKCTKSSLHYFGHHANE